MSVDDVNGDSHQIVEGHSHWKRASHRKSITSARSLMLESSNVVGSAMRPPDLVTTTRSSYVPALPCTIFPGAIVRPALCIVLHGAHGVPGLESFPFNVSTKKLLDPCPVKIAARIVNEIMSNTSFRTSIPLCKDSDPTPLQQSVDT